MPRLFGADGARILRYLLAGGTAWLADLAVFLSCLDALGIAGAQLVARAAGAIVAFFGHKLFVFEHQDLQAATLARQTLAYGALWAFAYGVSTVTLIALIEYLGAYPLAAKIGVEIGVVTMNFFVMKAWIFRPSGARQ